MIKELQKKGRKKIPENEKKKPFILYFTTEQTDILGGVIKTAELLQSFAEFKIKKVLKKQQNGTTDNTPS